MKDSVRIYYNKQCIFLTENALELINNNGLSNAWVMNKKIESGVLALFEQFAVTTFDNLVWQVQPDMALAKFINEFDSLQAAGGVVWNVNDELLMIMRLGKWDLPKGKLDAGEEIEACAVREVEEETGVHSLQLKRFILSTYHIYILQERWILKRTDWFEMSAEKDDLKPQAEEGISKAEWVSRESVPKKMQNTYANIEYLLEQFVRQ